MILRHRSKKLLHISAFTVVAAYPIVIEDYPNLKTRILDTYGIVYDVQENHQYVSKMLKKELTQ